jgi:hypothetical protein
LLGDIDMTIVAERAPSFAKLRRDLFGMSASMRTLMQEAE